MATQHTPGSLRQVQPGSNFQRGLGCAVLKAENDLAIATVATARGKGFANASRMVTCWNCHDDLLAALETLYKHAEIRMAQGINPTERLALDNALAAIIKGRGQ